MHDFEKKYPRTTAALICVLLIGALYLQGEPSDQETEERTAEAVKDIGRYDNVARSI